MSSAVELCGDLVALIEAVYQALVLEQEPTIELEPVAISGGGGVRRPFVSPNGQRVGFVSNDNTLRKVAITGGPAITLARADGSPRGATWAPDDTIIFATSNPTRACSACPPPVG